MKKIHYVLYKPGGNDTALVLGLEHDQTVRKNINDLIMTRHKNIEQVGFINTDKTNPELIMAGGEFCGNATRSAAIWYRNNKKGEISIKVSGVKNPLRAGVIIPGQAFAQMPIYRSSQFIKSDLEHNNNFIVEMEGIVHYIEFDATKIRGLTKDEIKSQGIEQIRRSNLDKYPAAGVMYVEQTEKGWNMTPIVYVKEINTEFLETSCGSGTTALGMVLAYQSKESVKDIYVNQPSGMPIMISVAYNGKTFSYAQISGPVEKLSEELLEYN